MGKTMEEETEEPLAPKNVTLRDPMDFASLRTRIYDRAQNAITESFPQSYGGVRLELKKTEYVDPPEFSIEDEKKALAKNTFLGRRLKGTMRLVDEKTNEVLDEKTSTLMKVPYLSTRGTFIHGGSDYSNLIQARLIPGIYTRKKKNGQIETQFNVRPGSGNSFRVNLDPETGQYRLNVGGSTIHMYSVLKDLGVDDETLQNRWGKEIWEANSAKYDKQAINKAYNKLVPRFMKDPNKEPSPEERKEYINNALNGIMVHERVVRKTLPNMFDMNKAAEWNNERTILEAFESQIPFAPTLSPEEALESLYDSDPGIQKLAESLEPLCEEVAKEAAQLESEDKEFDPSLGTDDLREEYNTLYGRQGPRLASMDSWPKEWFPEGSNELGWLDWYFGYANGKRTPDDERQIKRWKSFKSRHGAQFAQNPTPRRAFALRNWAIDPLSLVDDDVKDDVVQMMEDYKEKQQVKHSMREASANLDPTEFVKAASLLEEFFDFRFTDKEDKLTTMREIDQFLP